MNEISYHYMHFAPAIIIISLCKSIDSQRVWTSSAYPDVKKAKSMVCYQCKTDLSAIFQICESNMLKIATRAEKQDLLYFCPPFANTYCFKYIERNSNSTQVTRGCVGNHDSKGNLLKAGCVHFPKKDTTLCLCDNIACNKSFSNFVFQPIFITLLLLPIVYQ